MSFIAIQVLEVLAAEMLLNLAIALAISSALGGTIQYRNLQRADLSSASDLVIKSFGLNEQFADELTDRHERLVVGGFKHSMCVAVDDGTVVGFMEVGMLPSPVPRRTEWQGNIVESYPESPYIGNLCVQEAYRRQRIGYRLVAIGQKMAQKWGDDRLFVAVAQDNSPARKMYERMGYSLCLDEALLINRKLSSPPRVFYERDFAIQKIPGTVAPNSSA